MSISRLDPSKCYGCTACVEICAHGAIHTSHDEEGFVRPVVELEKCVECSLCETVCPALTTHQDASTFTQRIYAAYSNQPEVVSRSTSGGVFYHLAEMVISRGGAVYGAVYDNDFHVTHTCATTMDGVKAMHGAKYVQSHLPAGMYHDIRDRLRAGQWVLFSGTPCQTDAVRSYLRKDNEHLLLCDLVCRSVSSPMVYNDYLQFAQRKKTLKSVNMRWKVEGWGNTKFHLSFADGSSQTGKGDAQLWHDIHFSGLVTRPCCHQCPYTSMRRPGDITLGDFWGVSKSHAAFYHPKGVSLLMVNTLRGAAAFEKIAPSLHLLPSSAEACSQPALRKPVSPNPRRASFWKDYPVTPFMRMAKIYFRYGWLRQTVHRLRRALR